MRIGRICQIVSYILGYRQLVVHFERFGSIFCRFIEVGLGQSLHIRELVLLLVFLETRLDASEFLFYDDKPFIDEFGRVAGGPVLVVHPFVIIGVYQGAEDVFSPGRIGVFEGENHHGCLFA